MSREDLLSARSFGRTTGLVWAAFVVLPLVFLNASAPLAQAEFIGAKIQVEVSSELGTKTYDVDVTSTGDTFDWSLASPFQLWDSGTWLGTIQELEVSLDGDPNAFVFFSVLAGPAPTNFNVNSAIVGFTPYIGAVGSASGGVTVTDTGVNGATLTGNFAGATSFQAEYNNGLIFADLVTAAVAPAGSSITVSDSLLNVPIVPAVFNIQSKFSFVLSANDIGSGTGNFLITPEPSSICLAAAGAAGLAIFARRRRKA